MTATLRLLYQTLTPQWRRSACVLLLVFVPAAVMEALGISSIMPFIRMVTDYENVLAEDSFLRELYLWVGQPSPRIFFVTLGVIMLSLLVLANALGAASVWCMQLYCRRLNHELCMLLLERYLHQPYAYYLTRNRAVTSKNILMEAEIMVYMIVQPFLDMVAKLVIVAVVFSMLLAIYPLPTLLMSVTILLIYVLIYYLIRNILHAIGTRRVAANAERFKTVSEAFNAIKEIKLRNSERLPMEQFERPSRIYTLESCKHEIISRTTGYLVETVAFGGIVAVVVVLLAQQRETADILVQLGFFGFAAYRLMPATQRIYSSITRIRAHAESVSLIHRELFGEGEATPSLSSSDKDSQSGGERLLIRDCFGLRALSYRYPAANETLFKDLNLEVRKRETLGIVGPTGCGKTSLADLMLGLLQPASGGITVDGEALAPEKLASWQASLGYVPQHIYLCDDTIERNIAFAVREEDIDREEVRRAARIAQIHDYIECELPEGYATGVGDHGVRLSGGQIQRLGIARALYHQPDVVIFDEATSALDMQTEQAVMESLFSLQRSCTLVIIAHRLNTIKRCSRVVMLDQGKIVADGAYAQLLESSEAFRRFTRELDNQ